MPERLGKSELANCLQALDSQWESEGLPLTYRPMESFKAVYGSVQDKDGRKDLFEDLTVWYTAKYGPEAMKWDNVIARIPIFFCNNTWPLAIPFLTERAAANVTDHLENVPQGVLDLIIPEESLRIAGTASIAALNWHALYTLSCDDVFLTGKNRALCRRAQRDLQTAATTLYTTGDTQVAVFHAHAAVEKFLKIAFALGNSSVDTKDFGHRIRKLFNQLVATDKQYAWLFKSVDYLQDLVPDMSIRYSTVNISTAKALKAFYAALFLCGTIASMWNFDVERNFASPSFKVDRIYKNNSGSHCFCKRIEGDTVSLLLFSSNRWQGSQLVDMTVASEVSPLYLEISDPMEERNLRAQLLWQLQNRGERVRPDQIKMKTNDDMTGIYSVATLRRPVSKD